MNSLDMVEDFLVETGFTVTSRAKLGLGEYYRNSGVVGCNQHNMIFDIYPLNDNDSRIRVSWFIPYSTPDPLDPKITAAGDTIINLADPDSLTLLESILGGTIEYVDAGPL